VSAGQIGCPPDKKFVRDFLADFCDALSSNRFDVTQTMARGKLPFTKRGLARAYQGAVEAGIPNPRIEIAPNGTIAVMAGPAPESMAPKSEVNPWDEVLQ
jgi:hypothetical protein